MSTIKQKDFNQLLAEKVRELRLRHHLTPAECADLVGMKHRSYRRLEEGQAKRITGWTIKQFAEVFGLKTWELFDAVEKAAEG